MLLASSCCETRQTRKGQPIQACHVVHRNTLVCDTMGEGKQLSWGQGPERHKVATLDGTLFAKAGSITGGMAGNLAGRAQRWGDKEYETLKKVGCLV